MKANSFFFIAALLLLVSCKKEQTTYQPIPQADYMALQVGNYWIFEGYEQDSSGTYIPTGDWDSVYISKDTVIRGETYYKKHAKTLILSTNQQIYYVRDSAGYLVNHFGRILMSETNFSDTLFVDTLTPQLFRGYAMMIGKDSVVSVPAGDFVSATMRMSVVPTDTASPFPTRYVYWVYGKDVGEIKSHLFFYGGDRHFETRLVRYGFSQGIE
jgi:hypothetical protein